MLCRSRSVPCSNGQASWIVNLDLAFEAVLTVEMLGVAGLIPVIAATCLPSAEHPLKAKVVLLGPDMSFTPQG